MPASCMKQFSKTLHVNSVDYPQCGNTMVTMGYSLECETSMENVTSQLYSVCIECILPTPWLSDISESQLVRLRLCHKKVHQYCVCEPHCRAQERSELQK